MAQDTRSSVFLGIDHPAIAAEDVDKLANWYIETLGYEKECRHENPIWLLRAQDGTLLEIMPRDDTSRPNRTNWTPGWSHLAIRVADFDQAQAWLEEQGVQWTNDEIGAVGGGRLRNFVDPEGNMLQIVQRTSPC